MVLVSQYVGFEVGVQFPVQKPNVLTVDRQDNRKSESWVGGGRGE